ncbi:stalk domain-containing protein [Pseudomonas sp. dw_358]|uniref:copper amine oxidase n=1 Tax=Pseudomonas sp. dw_358 TaxID=2720083 RepID=UPI002116A8D6|nr:stalk domain-containing protein [Pseudomonas sp. dw_358]
MPKHVPQPSRKRRFFPSPLATTLAALLAASPMTQAVAHGGPVEMIELETSLRAFGASVHWDEYAGLYVINHNSAHIKLRPDSPTALVNGKTLKLTAPVMLKDGTAMMYAGMINELFQSDLDETFRLETRPHPLNPLTGAEISAAVSTLKQSPHYRQGMQFTDVSVHEPPKEKVWSFVYDQKATPLPRQASMTVLDGKKVFEALVDLDKAQLLQWKFIEGVHGRVLAEEDAVIDRVLKADPQYIQALKKRGVTDLDKVVTSTLTTGYFGAEDGLVHDARLLKVASYLDIGDGNFYAHPIDQLVAVVDLTEKKMIKLDDTGVLPIPSRPAPYDGRDQRPMALKPLDITEPQGKNYQLTGNVVKWHNWEFHLRMDTRVGPVLSTLTYNDKGVRRKVMYEGSLGGMIVPYGDPDIGWYFMAYLDSGDFGMGALTSSIERGTDVPGNAVLLDATLADGSGEPRTIPRAMALFERYAGPEYKHQEGNQPNVSAERRELVIRWISTVGNYDYIFDWVLQPNGTLGINAGATGIEAVKGVATRTMQDATAADDTRYGTLIDHNLVGTTHQHIYNFRLDLDIDGEQNSLLEIDPIIAENKDGGPRTTSIQTTQREVASELQAAQKYDPGTIRLIANTNKSNKVGNPVAYQVIPYAGGTHPIAKGAMFGPDEWLSRRFAFMDKQLWVTRHNPLQRYPEGKYPNRSREETGLGLYTQNDQSIVNQDLVVWLTTGTTHVVRSEEWPMMPTEWVNVLLKPWNFFDQTPTLYLNAPEAPLDAATP